MALEGVHMLLTYRCEHECDHCFVWGSPWAQGTMTLELIHELAEGEEIFPVVAGPLTVLDCHCMMGAMGQQAAFNINWDMLLEIRQSCIKSE